MATHFILQPQRKQGRSRQWVGCGPQQAQRFAVLERRTTTNGNPPREKTLAAFKTLAEAQQFHLSIAKKRKRPSPEPGSRYGPMGQRGNGTIIASGGRKTQKESN